MSQFGRLLRCYSWSRLSSYKMKHMTRNFTKCGTVDIVGSKMLPSVMPTSYNTVLTISSRAYSTNNQEDSRLLREFDDAVNETLIGLSDMFDDIAETLDVDTDYDVSFENDVLTVMISKSWGTYVINKQSPNRQIWLSSPIRYLVAHCLKKSGPKRYDLVNGKWVYSHDGKTLHELLTKEISEALQHELDFTECAFGK